MEARSNRLQDLYRALYEHPDELLQGIASTWQLEIVEGNRELRVRHLAEGMQDSQRLRKLTDHLSDGARMLLAKLASQGGLVPAHRLAGDYGTVRRLGPSALRREAPWESPQNPVEELYYRGLAYRTYADVGRSAIEGLQIPEPLLTRVRDLGLEPTRVALEPVAQPPQEVLCDDAATAQEDLLALLVHLRNQAPRIPVGGDLGQLLVEALIGLRERGRLLGEWGEQRLSFLAALALGADLVVARGKAVAPSPRARAWLRAGEGERYRALLQAWRRQARWDELRLANLALVGDQQDYDAPGARSVVLGLLARAPVDTWLSLASLVQAVKRTRPDLLRTDGDYDAWQLRDTDRDQLVSGYAQWDRIEGAVVAVMLSGPLRWLGIVEIGSDDDSPATSFRLPSGRLPRWRRGQGDPDPTPGPTLCQVSEDGTVRITSRDTCYTRYQLERFAAWEGQDAVAQYRITEGSVAAGYRAGVKTAHMIPFLQRISGGNVPQPLLARLLAWGGRLGRVWARRTIVLETVDKATMRELRADPEIKPYLDLPVDGTHHLVRERDADELLNMLRARGIWVQVIEGDE